MWKTAFTFSVNALHFRLEDFRIIMIFAKESFVGLHQDLYVDRMRVRMRKKDNWIYNEPFGFPLDEGYNIIILI